MLERMLKRRRSIAGGEHLTARSLDVTFKALELAGRGLICVLFGRQQVVRLVALVLGVAPRVAALLELHACRFPTRIKPLHLTVQFSHACFERGALLTVELGLLLAALHL